MTNEERAALMERLLERRITADVMPWMRPDALCVEAADQIEAQAKRIAELERLDKELDLMATAFASSVEEKKKRIEELEEMVHQASEPSPYCPICGSCGEEGCCGDKRCKYPDTGLRERIEELEREKAAMSDLLEQREELALEYLFDCNREAGKVAYLEQQVEIARKRIEELEAALRPFARAKRLHATHEYDGSIRCILTYVPATDAEQTFTLAALDNAQAALAKTFTERE